MSNPFTSSKGRDIEAGDGRFYPSQMENPELRWGFIRKVYSILSIQMLLTVAVASIVIFTPAIPNYLLHTTPGLAIYITIVILPLIIMCPLFAYMNRHPVNLILLGLFTVTVAFAVGMSCSFSKGKVVLEAAILTSVVVVGLTLYTFWAAKQGYDFSFLGPFLFTSLLVLMVFMFIQILFPMGKIGVMVYGCIASIIFSAFIIYDTDNLIKRYDYDEYIPAAVSLYLDIINLFQAILAILSGSDN